MKRWDFEIGGLVFVGLFAIAILMLVASLVGHVLQFFGLL